MQSKFSKFTLLITLLLFAVACDGKEVISIKEESPNQYYFILIYFITPPLIQLAYLIWATIKNKFHESNSKFAPLLNFLYALSLPLNLVGVLFIKNITESTSSLKNGLFGNCILLYTIGLFIQFIVFIGIISNYIEKPE